MQCEQVGDQYDLNGVEPSERVLVEHEAKEAIEPREDQCKEPDAHASLSVEITCCRFVFLFDLFI